MRPDIEDFEELSIPETDEPRSRAMSWLVLAVAVGGFGALAYYAYHSGTQNMQNGDVMVVQADQAPIKEAPANPEGEQFANQDKTIYDVIAPNGSESKTEKLLPDAEKPVAAPQEAAARPPESETAQPGPTTFVNKNLTDSTPATTAKTDAAAKPAPMVVPVPSNKAAETKPAAGSANPPKVVQVAQNSSDDDEAGEPTFVNESPVVTDADKAAAKTETKATAKTEAKPAAKTEAKPAAKKEEAKPAVKPAASTSGSGMVQLGAFKSEDEANAAWKKISAKSGGILSGSPSIQKADLPNGTFYRLRASVSGSAKDVCAKLSAKGQACIVAK